MHDVVPHRVGMRCVADRVSFTSIANKHDKSPCQRQQPPCIKELVILTSRAPFAVMIEPGAVAMPGMVLAPARRAERSEVGQWLLQSLVELPRAITGCRCA